MSQSCHTHNCEGEVGDNSSIGLCKSCYSYMYYWHKKTPKELIHRARRLQIFEARMDLLVPINASIERPKRGKIKPLAIMPGEFKKGKRPKKAKLRAVA